MAAEIGLLSMNQIQKLSQSQHLHNKNNQPQPHQPNPNPSGSGSSTNWMWNPVAMQEDDDSWEVRAFAEDTRNIMGTTWPPRSYTCTFCRREFRSAQALGGHMNVHRRDRARLHQAPPLPGSGSSHLSPTSAFINIPPEELVANSGVCVLYNLPNPNATFTTTNNPTATTTNLNATADSAFTLLSISPYPQNTFPVAQVPANANGINGTFPNSYLICNSSKVEQEPSTSSIDNGHHEELDLELRLGHRPTHQPDPPRNII